ncbi:MAG: hypothetical protein LBV34_09205 [Nocardiopsaceae bacterium]|jgi:hypothetical protein|nr:hypothetical protein [Nocardiopsaceae bacterium]
MNKRVALVSAIVVVALAAVVFGATAALRLIGGSTFSKPLSEADVRHSLAAAASTPGTSPGATATTSPGGTQPGSPNPSKAGGPTPGKRTAARMFSGNTVFASCTGSQARITSWVPANGYSADESSTGPARSAWVKFKSATSELTVTVTCPGGRPNFTTASDDRGGGHGGGGSGRGRGGGG